MKTFGICRFCNIVSGQYQHADIDRPFCENDAFIAVASIGALIEGWSLIIPKKHQLSMKATYNRPELEDIMDQVIPSIVRKYRPLIAFEHGSNREGSITACGTDHAHLHLVPFSESLIPSLENSNLHWVKCHASEIASRVGNNEYLFYSEVGTKDEWRRHIGYLHILERPISQYFRQLIAARTGHYEASDYRKFPYLETSKQTRKTLVGSEAQIGVEI